MERLDRRILALYPDFSRSRIEGLIKAGFVTVNGAVAGKAGMKVADGDVIAVEIPPPVPAVPEPEDLPLDVIFEDADLLVVNKSPGMVVHPAPGHFTGTLVNALLHRCPDLSGIGGVARPGIVHRLDQDTSGLIVVAKSQAAMNGLVRAFASHRDVEKTYLAICHGRPQLMAGRIENLIGRHPVDRKRMAVVEKNGKLAITNWRVVTRAGGDERAWEGEVRSDRSGESDERLGEVRRDARGEVRRDKSDKRLGEGEVRRDQRGESDGRLGEGEVRSDARGESDGRLGEDRSDRRGESGERALVTLDPHVTLDLITPLDPHVAPVPPVAPAAPAPAAPAPSARRGARPLTSLVECRIETGRTHQIRVHMAALGCPVVGDRTYGKPALDKRLSPVPARQLLHAWKLRLWHPVKGVEMRFEAPLPADFRAYLAN
ncbi:MAG: pseudouridine synthase [Kiritimatiellia bacterium]